MDNDDNLSPISQPTIKVSDFEGPLDLLLHLIRSSEMDIYDIQISDITGQYLDYLHNMKENQLEVAGEYVVMAATLMSIKSRMLLPNEPVEDEFVDDEEPVDPRQELVDQLIEYKRYKQAAQQLKEKEELRQQEYTRQAMGIPAGVVSSKLAPGVTIQQLQAAFDKVLKRKQINQPLNQTVQGEAESISARIKTVLQQVITGTQNFEDLFEDQVTVEDLVTTFFAILELSKHQAILINQDDTFGPLTLAVGPKSEEYNDDQFGED
ncbi:segregation and condensation protein A [Paucilactobacillus nenjiangensis]|uniref:segregation and condensation protein A n=1 Tax=Paucilactobacillus nenjiangensis TaxID=1296540 RepID=UPI003FA20C1F